MKPIARIVLFRLIIVTLFISPLLVSTVSAYSDVVPDFSSVKDVHWQRIWRYLNKKIFWQLQYRHPVQNKWYVASDYMTIHRTYPTDQSVKIALEFTAPYAGDYRLIFALKKQLLQYVQVSEYAFNLTYREYQLLFDFSDLMEISGVTRNFGVTTIQGTYGPEQWAYGVFRKNNIPKDAYVYLDPYLSIEDTFGDYSMISSYYNVTVTGGHVQLSGGVPDHWWNADWLYSRSVTTDHLDVSSDLTDFPALIYLNSSYIDWTHVQDDLDDIRFTTDNVTTLSYEIDNYVVNDEAWIWVKIPSVDNDVDTSFFMYYGNDAAVNGENTTDVWDAYFVGVWHLDDDPDTSTVQDSTSNDYDGTKQAAGEPLENVNGQIDDDQDFGGDTSIDDYINVGSGLSVNNITIECWGNSDDLTNVAPTKSCRFPVGTADRSYSTYVGTTTDKPTFVIHNGVGYQVLVADTAIVIGTWYYYAYTYDNTDMRIYRNGALDCTPKVVSGNIRALSGQDVYIGYKGAGVDGYFDGDLDEVRISNQPRSPSWINATYETERYDFITLGSEETPPGYSDSGWFYSTNLLDDRNATEIVSLWYNCTITGSETIEISFSQDNSTWVTHDGVSGWETLTTGEHTLNLRGLAWDSSLFFYRINMTKDSETPELHHVTLYYSVATQIGNQLSILLLGLMIGVPLIVVIRRR